MSNHKPCLEHREAVAGLVLGVLPAEAAARQREHLAGCVGCRAFHESLQRQEHDLAASVGVLARAVQAQAALPATANRKSPAVPIKAARRPDGPGRWRQLRAATAVAIGLVAVVAGLSLLTWPGGRGPIAGTTQAAYAEVLGQIERARSVRYIKTAYVEGRNPIVMEQMLLEGGRARTVFRDSTVSISHYGTGDELQLDPVRKTAELVHVVQPDRERLMNVPEWIRALRERAGLCEGQQLLDGRVVDVYRLDQPYEKMTVWTDPQTHLPVRVETVKLPATDKDIRVPRMTLAESDFWPETGMGRYAGGLDRVWGIVETSTGVLEQKITVVLSDFAWNIPLDESLFSLTPPEGYTLRETTEFGNSTTNEAALVAALRFWAETSDGRFPENINMLADTKPNLVRRYRGAGSPREAFEQAIPMMQTVLHGMLFAQRLKIEDNWHYAGGDVQLGESDKPLAWWLDKETRRWRVVYGDLTVKDLQCDQPPTGHEGRNGRGEG